MPRVHVHLGLDGNAVYRINSFTQDVWLNPLLIWGVFTRCRSWGASAGPKKRGFGREKREKVVMGGGRWRGVATQRFAAWKELSGVNLLEELESSAGCHLFSTLSTLPLSTSPSPSVNRVISAALVSVLRRHISPFQLRWLHEPLNSLPMY